MKAFVYAIAALILCTAGCTCSGKIDIKTGSSRTTTKKSSRTSGNEFQLGDPAPFVEQADHLLAEFGDAPAVDVIRADLAELTFIEWARAEYVSTSDVTRNGVTNSYTVRISTESGGRVLKITIDSQTERTNLTYQ